MYWGASVEAQSPFSFLPKDVGMKVAVFADAGSLWDYKGPTSWNVTGETLTPVERHRRPRASVGVGLIWNSPFGPLRFDYAFPLLEAELRPDPAVPVRRRHQVLVIAARHAGSRPLRPALRERACPAQKAARHANRTLRCRGPASQSGRTPEPAAAAPQARKRGTET